MSRAPVKIVSAEQMREIERKAFDLGLPSPALMENAGRAVADALAAWVGGAAGKRILVLVGPGNNGGDGLVAARHLSDAGARVFLYLCMRDVSVDVNFRACAGREIPFASLDGDADLQLLEAEVRAADVVLDALLGTGKARPITGRLRDAMQAVAAARRPETSLVALDLPSGLNADTGAVDESTLPADLTLTLGYPKVGLFQLPAVDCVGEIEVLDIGIPSGLADEVPVELATSDLVRQLLPPRPRSAHKGTFGKLMVIASSINYIGAAYLACVAAGRVGAGLVTLAMPASLHPILATKLTESTFLPLPEDEPGVLGPQSLGAVLERLPDYDAVLLGCGLGARPVTVDFVLGLLRAGASLPRGAGKGPLAWLVDADGLNALATSSDWWQYRPAHMVVTPHPGEMARLRKGRPVASLSRFEVALQAAQEWGCIVVLKGAYTAVASPTGRATVNPFANPALATAGTGDVLAGSIASLLAQGQHAYEAAIAGAYLHGLAGEMVAERIGSAGALAGDLLPMLPQAIQTIKHPS